MAFMRGGLALDGLAAHSSDRVSGQRTLPADKMRQHQSKTSRLAG